MIVKTRDNEITRENSKYGIEVKTINDSDLVLWTRPVKIKDNWYNAILQKPTPTRKSNIQFIMRCNLAYSESKETSYIVVSKEPMTLAEINKINLNNYIFDNSIHYSKGVDLICQ